MAALVLTGCGGSEDPRLFQADRWEPRSTHVGSMSARLVGDTATVPPSPDRSAQVEDWDGREQGLVILADPVALELVGKVLEKPFERVHPEVDLVFRESGRRSVGEDVLRGYAGAALIAGELSEPEYRRGMVHEILGYHIHEDAVPVDGVRPGLQDLLDGTYPHGCKVQLVSRGSSRTDLRLFLEFARSREGIQLLSDSLALLR